MKAQGRCGIVCEGNFCEFCDVLVLVNSLLPVCDVQHGVVHDWDCAHDGGWSEALNVVFGSQQFNSFFALVFQEVIRPREEHELSDQGRNGAARGPAEQEQGRPTPHASGALGVCKTLEQAW